MFKAVLAFAFCVVLASANLRLSVYPTPSDFTNLFQGFNDKLNITNNQDFTKCAKVPLIPDIQKTFRDLNETKPNPLALVADVMALYGDYNNVKNNCPQLAKSYEAFFAPFEQALQNNTSATLLRVAQNVLGSITQIQAAALQATQDLGAQNYYNAGADVATVIGLSLAGLL